MVQSANSVRLGAALTLVVALAGCVTGPPPGGPTGTLEPGGSVVHESGVALLAPDGSLANAVDVTIEPAEDPTSDVPLPAGLEAVGEAYRISSSAGSAANPGFPLVVSSVIEPGEDLDDLRIAVLDRDGAFGEPYPPGDEATGLRPSWIVLETAYDVESRRLLAPVLALTSYGWDAIVVRSDAFEGISTTGTNATITGQQTDPGFVGVCGTGFGHAPETCDFTDETLAAALFEDAYDELTGFGFTTNPRLERALVAVDFDGSSLGVGVTLGGYRIELRPASTEIAAGMYSSSTGRVWIALDTDGLTEDDRTRVRHEYVHATQYGYAPSFDSDAEWLRSRWVIEGQAVLLESSYGAVVRASGPRRAVDDPLERSRWTGSTLGPFPSSEYHAQDFWLYLANRFGHTTAAFLEPFMTEGMRTVDIDQALRQAYPSDFGAGGLAGGLSLAYWSWVKDQVFQRAVASGTRGPTCTFAGSTARETMLAYDPSAPPSSTTVDLPPLTSHVYRIDLAAAGTTPYAARLVVESSSAAVRSTFFPQVPSSPTGCFGQPDASDREVAVDGDARTHYVLVSNTSRTRSHAHTLSFPDPRTLAVTSPSDGASFEEGVAVVAAATAVGYDDPRITWTWRRPLDRASFTFGTTGSDEPIRLPTLCDGTYVLEAEAREGLFGPVVSTSIDLTIDDRGAADPPAACAPTVRIDAPFDGATYASGEAIALLAAVANDSPPSSPRYPVEWRLGGPAGALLATGLTGEVASGFAAGTVELHVSYGSASDQVTLSVIDATNAPPDATITDPHDGTTYSFFDPEAGATGVAVSVSGEGTSPDEGTLTGASLTWSMRQTVPTVTAWTAEGSGDTIDVTLPYASCFTQTFEVRLTATDSEGLFDTDTVELFLIPPYC